MPYVSQRRVIEPDKYDIYLQLDWSLGPNKLNDSTQARLLVDQTEEFVGKDTGNIGLT